VQCAIQEVIEDMLRGFLDYKKAALALYGLQTAASNLKQMRIADEQRRKREEEQACSVERSACSEEDEYEDLPHDSFEGARLQPCHKAHKNDPALAAEVRVPLDEDDLEEIELTADSARPTTTDHRPTTSLPTTDHRPTTSLPTDAHRPPTFIESPRPPQRITQGLLTKTEREARDKHLPDLEKLRAEILRDAGEEDRELVSA
jgi:hypothetical protein